MLKKGATLNSGIPSLFSLLPFPFPSEERQRNFRGLPSEEEGGHPVLQSLLRRTQELCRVGVVCFSWACLLCI